MSQCYTVHELEIFFLEKNYSYVKHYICTWTELQKEKKTQNDLVESGSMNDFPSHLKMFPVVKNCLCNTYNYKAIK